MAEVPRGAGQQETNPRGLNVPGLYMNDETGIRTHVTMPAAADALVQRGWTLLREGQTLLDDDGNALSEAALKALLHQKGPLPQSGADSEQGGDDDTKSSKKGNQ